MPNSQGDAIQYRGYTARFTAFPLVNKGFYFCQAWVYSAGSEQEGEVVSGRGLTPSEARQDCEMRVKKKVDTWLRPENA
ncbi:MAG TPA: hypothetical protein VGK99_14735 [Acidobacteriota bacterium]|jgi:hypothetical protein